jgi:hypothetical protein
MTMYLQASRVIAKKLGIKNLVFVCILKATEEKSRIWGRIRFRFNQWFASADLDLYQNVTDPGSGTQLYRYLGSGNRHLNDIGTGTSKMNL